MPKNERRFAKGAMPEKAGEVGTADSGDFDRDCSFSFSGFRKRLFLELNPARRRIDQRSHGRQYKPTVLRLASD
jgi:hypothetical protein